MDRLGVTKEKALPFIFSVALTAAFFVDTNFLHGYLLTGMWLFIAIALALIATAIMLLAAYAVTKAFVQAGAALSLLILLAQSYCGLPTHTADGALASLVSIVLLYIFFEFGSSLQETCKAFLKRLGEDRRSWQGKVVIGVFLLYALFFGWAIYSVTSPIIFSLCVYK